MSLTVWRLRRGQNGFVAIRTGGERHDDPPRSHHGAIAIEVASARRLADLLGVEWAETALGAFSAVRVNDGLTLDFIDADVDSPVHHFCFRVDDAEFDAILGRIQAAKILYRSCELAVPAIKRQSTLCRKPDLQGA